MLIKNFWILLDGIRSRLFGICSAALPSYFPRCATAYYYLYYHELFMLDFYINYLCIITWSHSSVLIHIIQVAIYFEWLCKTEDEMVKWNHTHSTFSVLFCFETEFILLVLIVDPTNEFVVSLIPMRYKIFLATSCYAWYMMPLTTTNVISGCAFYFKN